MALNLFPMCYFPTTTVIIDDNEDFLHSLPLKLNHKNNRYKYFSNAEQALDFIENNLKLSEWYNDYINILKEEEFEHKIIDFNIRDVHKKIYDPSRFDIISSVVMDYDMPTINGIELCERFRENDFSKILLTGAADEKIAIEAFNKGLINCYIPKQAKDVYFALNSYINEGCRKYFKNISNILLTSIKNDREANILFKSTDFYLLFQNIISENNIIEYYLIDTNGSYLMLSANGTFSVLFINCEEQLNSMHYIASEENFNELAVMLKDKCKMVCYFDPKSNTLPPIEDWDKFLKDCQKITFNEKNYYYAYVKDIVFNKKYI